MIITKQFLESYPLYKKLLLELPYHADSITDIGQPAINMYCKVCKSVQTFNNNNNYWEVHASNQSTARNTDVWGSTFRVKYICSSCNSYEFKFFLEFIKTGKSKSDENNYIGYVWKIGQTPPWEIDIDQNLAKALSEDAGLYKKGLVCESQSYGIGSYAYFRRITENVIDELLNSITDLLDEEDKARYQAALEKVKKTRVTEEKIELVQDLLPSSLQPDGFNPLKALHSALSDGIHDKTDEECLDLAETIKAILTYLLEEIRSRSDKAKNFSDKMKKLLGKK
ncbi:MAG: hypothetical protein H6774_01055 [Pseudomonadales bacterium]|nr:hypothetical protein [Pseudomonadales bacterium]